MAFDEDREFGALVRRYQAQRRTEATARSLLHDRIQEFHGFGNTVDVERIDFDLLSRSVGALREATADWTTERDEANRLAACLRSAGLDLRVLPDGQ